MRSRPSGTNSRSESPGTRLEGVLEIGPKVFAVRGNPFQPPDKVDDASAIRFQSKKPNQHEFTTWAEQTLNAEIRSRRLRDRGIDPAAVAAVQEPRSPQVSCT